MIRQPCRLGERLAALTVGAGLEQRFRGANPRFAQFRRVLVAYTFDRIDGCHHLVLSHGFADATPDANPGAPPEDTASVVPLAMKEFSVAAQAR